MAREISNSDDMIDSRDVIARLEDLRDEIASLEGDDFDAGRVAGPDDPVPAETRDELAALESLADEGGRSADWAHGETLIRDSYFEDYARDLAEDIGAVAKDAPWPACHIDWEAAADALKVDYFDVDYDGVTYWIRG